MALFGKKEQKNTTDTPMPETKVDAKKATRVAAPRDLSSVLIRPRVTEKAMLSTEKGVYVFEVHADATKYDVRDAVKEAFKVTPEKIHITVKRPRTYMSRMRGKRKESGLKKAYVYLKKGDSITF